MKILHVNKFFDFRDGVGTVLAGTMERQRAQGHEVHVFSTRSPNNAPSSDASYFIERYDYAVHQGLRKDITKGLAFLWNREAQRAFERMLDVVKPDVIHLHNIYHHFSTSILKPIRDRRIPCVQTLHDYKLACPNYKMYTEGAVCERCRGGRYYEAIRHHCLFAGTMENMLGAFEMGFTKLTQAYERTVRVFICPSQFMSDKMVSWGEPASKMMTVLNAVDLSPTIATRKGGYLFIAARLSKEKGHEVLIRAMARVPEMKLKIAGTGPEESRLKALAESLGATNVEFLGFVRRSERPELWSEAAAMVAPSVWYENGPLSVLEAMADGLPIIASRIGGLPEMVRHGENGLLVEPSDVDAWIAAIREFAQTPEEIRSHLAEQSRAIAAETFTWDRHMSLIAEAYRRAGALG